MAILGSITLNEIEIYEVDVDPSTGGLTAASGSMAILTDGSGLYLKGEGGPTDWSLLPKDVLTRITDAKNRANHTGTQLASTISDFTTAVQAVTIDAAKIDGGTVSNAEYATLDGITTGISIQSQINGKEPTLTKGNLTEATSAVLTITGGTGSVIGSGTSIQVKQASASQNGYLSSTDWSTFNGKQSAGNYITALTGDVTASGPGSVAATLSTTGVSAGTYSQVTVDTKGRVTSGTNVGNPTVYKYTNTIVFSSSTGTYTTVTALTSISLPVGLYKYSFSGLMQSALATSGVGVRVSPVGATVTTCYGDFHLKQSADGLNSVFHYQQLNTTTNVTSASVPTANSDFVVSGSGVFRVTVAGTVAIQIRCETAGNAATLQPDSSFIIEPT